jgi:uncharacterized phage-associated protein
MAGLDLLPVRALRKARALWARVTYRARLGTYRAATVANYLLDLAEANGRKLTPLQLLKLVYISHGWSLGLRDKPLIHEAVEAWKYGPVIPDLYHELKQYGSAPITGKVSAPFWNSREELSPEDKAFVQGVFAKYGQLNGIQLSHLIRWAVRGIRLTKARFSGSAFPMTSSLPTTKSSPANAPLKPTDVPGPPADWLKGEDWQLPALARNGGKGRGRTVLHA